MKIIFNDTELSIDAQQISVARLAALKEVPAAGVAIAVNNKVVRKADWETTLLHDGDNVMVITAVCGG